MNKKLVAVFSAAMSISAAALAANPFSDVPAGHWAYGAVARLAAEGVVDGYPDGSFQGSKTMTRYEMAQITAKALAKGAIGSDDRLVGEFADELDNLGVRVAKLEKNADQVKITGNVRLRYRDSSGRRARMDGQDDSTSQLRTRLWLTGEVNDNWNYTAMLQNTQDFEGQNESGDGTTTFQRAFLKGKIGTVGIKAGRDHLTLADSYVYNHRADYVQVSIPVKDAYIKANYGKLADADNGKSRGYYRDADSGRPYIGSGAVADTFWSITAGGDVGNLKLEANYIKADDPNYKKTGLNDDAQIWTLGAKYKMGDFRLSALYLKGDDDTLKGTAHPGGEDDGYVIGLDYKGAKSKKPGTWGLTARYFDQAAPTMLKNVLVSRGAWAPVSVDSSGHTVWGTEGYKGYQVGANWTLDKNMVAAVDYYDLKGKESHAHDRTLWSQLVVTF